MKPILTPEQESKLEALTENYSDHEIAQMFGVKAPTIRARRIKLGISSYTQKTGQMKDKSTGQSRRRGTHTQFNSDSLKVNYFSEIDLPEKAYWIGMLATDGCVSENSRIQLSLDYKDHATVYAFAKALGAVHFLKERTVINSGSLAASKQSHCSVLRITSQQMALDLMREGITPRKTKTIQISPCASKYPQAYLRGYLDGDGGVYKTNFIFCSGSELCIDQVRALINSHTGHLLYKKSQTSKDTGRNVWVLQGVRSNQPILDWLYKDLEGIPFMERKYSVFLRYWLERTSSYWKDRKSSN